MRNLIEKLRALPALPLPGGGHTSARHDALIGIAREDLSLARLAEAHFDALSILAEAGRSPVKGALYGVWASEIPAQAVTVSDFKIYGKKRFCTGAGLLDRALVTVTDQEHTLIDLDLREAPDKVFIDNREWITIAFADTSTATVTFDGTQSKRAASLGHLAGILSDPAFGPVQSAQRPVGREGLSDLSIGLASRSEMIRIPSPT